MAILDEIWDCRFTLALMKDGIWGCRFTLAIIYYGVWDLSFYLALMEFGTCRFTWQLIGDNLFGTYRIAHRIGGLFVVCGCSILVSRYVGVSYWSTEIWVSYGVARHYDLR